MSKERDSFLCGLDATHLFHATLDAMERGTDIKLLRQEPQKYLVSGKTKEIVINEGGEGLKVSRELLEEMKKRGDTLATHILETNQLQKSYAFGDVLEWAYLEWHLKGYDRENTILLEVLKEGKIHNVGGWTLTIWSVPVEDWAYSILKSDDHWGSEYIEGQATRVTPDQTVKKKKQEQRMSQKTQCTSLEDHLFVNEDGKDGHIRCRNCKTDFSELHHLTIKNFIEKHLETDESLQMPHIHIWSLEQRKCCHKHNYTNAKDGTMRGFLYTPPAQPGYGAQYEEIPGARQCNTPIPVQLK